MEPLAPDSYPQFLADLKSRIRAAQLRASVAVNRELVLLYWQIGRDILDRQQRENWGAKVIDRLATDLKREFPDRTKEHDAGDERDLRESTGAAKTVG